MPIRIRKTFTLFPGVKVNMSKGGMSITVGTKGMHLNFSKRGVRQTVGVPGSGISESSYLFKNKDKDEDEKESKEKESKKEEHSSEESDDKPKKRRTRRTAQGQASSPWGFFLFVVIALFFIYFHNLPQIDEIWGRFSIFSETEGVYLFFFSFFCLRFSFILSFGFFLCSLLPLSFLPLLLAITISPFLLI